MAVIEDIRSDSGAPAGYGPNGTAVVELIARARHLTLTQAHAISGAVAWQWQPLALPIRGSFTTARSEALAAAKVAGRQAAAISAEQDAGAAALESPGGRAISTSWSWAENGLAGVIIGVMGAILSATAGILVATVGFGLLAVVGAGVLLLYESGRVSRHRIRAGVAGAALALVVGDLLAPETRQSLSGPWSTVMHD